MTWTRRQFTFSLGASLLCAPFIDLLSRRGAHAAPSGKPARLIIFFTPNGTVHNRLWPQGGETDFQFAAGSILEPLAPHRKELIILDGIDFIGVNNHEAGMANMLTGGGRISVDQHIAAEIGKGARFPSLEFGVQTSAWGGNVQTRMCYDASGKTVTPEDDPLGMYKRLFGAAAGGQAEAERLLRRKKSILDHLRAELTDLHGQLGKAEQAKLEGHLTAVREVEANLSAPQRCDAPKAPAARAREALYSHGNFSTIGKDQVDLMLLALRCGLTQVASIQWSHTVGPHVFSWIGEGQGHHELSHQKNQSFVNCERWFAGQFAALLEGLKAAPDPQGGTLMDSTLVLWAKELGDGSLHTCSAVPFVLAGGAGYFRTGRYLKYRGAPHQQLLTSICQAMGLPTETFGDRNRGSGPLAGLR